MRTSVQEKRAEAAGWLGFRLVAAVLVAAVLFPVTAAAQNMMTEQTYNRLERVHEAMEEDDYEEARELITTVRERAQNDHELSIIEQLSGFIHLNEENYREALEDFKKSIDYGGLQVRQQLTVIANVAQLHAQFEEYDESLDYVDRYLDLVEESEDHDEAPPRIYLIGARAYMEKEEYRQALPYIEKAIELSDEPNEDHYRVLLGVHFELEQFPEAAEVLQKMLGFWPDKMQYWFQLYSVNMQMERDSRALDVLSLAHRKELFEDESHYVNLSRMYIFQGAPFEAGEVLQEGIDEGVVDADEGNLDMLSRAWIQAKEYDRAIDVLRDLAEFDESGEPYLRIAQLQQERARWERTYDAAMEAFERGDLEEPGDALLLAGRAAAESKQYDRALSAFNRAMEYEDVREQASQWVRYVEEERSLLEQ